MLSMLSMSQFRSGVVSDKRITQWVTYKNLLHAYKTNVGMVKFRVSSLRSFSVIAEVEASSFLGDSIAIPGLILMVGITSSSFLNDNLTNIR